MKQILEFIAKALVDNPDAVTVNEIYDGHTTVLELRVAEEDMGKVIGRQGKIARAIRMIIKAAALKQNRKVIVEIVQ